jgi:choline transport protein
MLIAVADSVGSTAGATVMTAVVIILTWACATGIITTASRMTWSFARDKGTPFSHALAFVSKTRRVPLVALGTACFLAALLTLIYIGSYTAFNDVVSLTITGFYSSYFLPAAFLLYRRVKKQISPHELDTPGFPVRDDPENGSNSDDNNLEKSNIGNIKPPNNSSPTDPSPVYSAQHDRRASLIAQAPLQWGPFHLPGWLGIINNAYACCYMIFVIFWSVWPPVTPVDAETMNYSVVVTGGVVIFSMVWYFVRGRKEYQGPTVDEEVVAVMRLGSVARI